MPKKWIVDKNWERRFQQIDNGFYESDVIIFKFRFFALSCQLSKQCNFPKMFRAYGSYM
jgi:hypothetical protein